MFQDLPEEKLKTRIEAKGIKYVAASIGRTAVGSGFWLVTIYLPSGAVTTLSAETGREDLYSDRTLDDVAHRVHRYVTRPAPRKVPALLPEDAETP